jgi:hypothetical protein
MDGTETDSLTALVQRLQTASDALDGADGPDAAVEALERLQVAARDLAAEVERRRRVLQEERGDGQLDLL